LQAAQEAQEELDFAPLSLIDVLLDLLADLGENLGGEFRLLRVGIEYDGRYERNLEWLLNDTVTVSLTSSEPQVMSLQ
jgi:hypothetical protein